MGWYSKGFSVKQKDFNINELLNIEFPLGFIDIPFQLIEAGRPSGIFSPIDQNCIVVKRTNNTTYVFFKNIENQIKIEKGISPKYLKELNNDWLYFNNEIQEFYLKSDSSLPDYPHVGGGYSGGINGEKVYGFRVKSSK